MIRKVLYISFVILLCIAVAPFLVVIAVCIFLISGSPVFFRQKRVGKDGRVFLMYKFRTMTQDAEEKQGQLQKLNEADGPVFKIRNDPRFTPIGIFLAHTGLDELPQLFNVLIGDMALVGPRPLPVKEARKLKTWQKERQKIQPGIISPWILEGYHKQTFDAWMKSDCLYAKEKSTAHDVGLVMRTVGFLARLLLREITGVD